MFLEVLVSVLVSLFADEVTDCPEILVHEYHDGKITEYVL